MRPIDAGYAMEAISRHRKPTPVGQYGSAYNDGINAAIQEILLAPTLTPPNEPLTLEQLRASPHGKIKDSTLQSICNRANEIARRPPEGEED